MDSKEYQEQAMRTAAGNPDVNAVHVDLLHSVIGLCTEVGELNDAVKRAIFYRQPLDVTNLSEEFGDILWYIAVGMTALDLNFEDVMAQNIAKLKARFPEKFTEENAVERDLDKEREILDNTTQVNND